MVCTSGEVSMMTDTANSFQIARKLIISMVVIAGRIIGISICASSRKVPQPSITAASSRVSGILLKALTRSIVFMGALQPI